MADPRKEGWAASAAEGYEPLQRNLKRAVAASVAERITPRSSEMTSRENRGEGGGYSRATTLEFFASGPHASVNGGEKRLKGNIFQVTLLSP